MTERLTATTAPYTIGIPPFRPGEDADFGGAFKEQPGDPVSYTHLTLPTICSV